MSFENDWEEQDLDLGLMPETVVVEAPVVVVGAGAPVESPETVVAPVDVEAPVEADDMLTPRMYIFGILEKTCKLYKVQKSLPPHKRTVRQYNMERDTSVYRTDIIRDILDGHAILINGVIEWKHAFALRKYNVNDTMLKTPTNWVIRTNLEKHKRFVKGCDDIQYALTKAQIKKGERAY